MTRAIRAAPTATLWASPPEWEVYERMFADDTVAANRQDGRSLPFANAIAGTLNLLPRAAIGAMLKHIDFLASNVPGIRVPLYLAGAKVDSWYRFGPTIGAALNVTLMSYCGTCFVGVNIDTGAVRYPDVLMDCLHKGFDEVLAITGATDTRYCRPESLRRGTHSMR